MRAARSDMQNTPLCMQNTPNSAYDLQATSPTPYSNSSGSSSSVTAIVPRPAAPRQSTQAGLRMASGGRQFDPGQLH